MCRVWTSSFCDAGTIFQDARSPLRLWFRTMGWVAAQKSAASALGLQRVLGLKNYRRLGVGCISAAPGYGQAQSRSPGGNSGSRRNLPGRLEEDLRGRHVETKALIDIAPQEDGQGIGRISLRHIAAASAASVMPFIEEAVEPGSVVHTDGWLGYEPLKRTGYRHKITFLRGQKKSHSELMPRVHRVVSLLKRWLIGTHQGAVSHKHLAYYLDELLSDSTVRRSAGRGNCSPDWSNRLSTSNPSLCEDHPEGRNNRLKNLSQGHTLIAGFEAAQGGLFKRSFGNSKPIRERGLFRWC